MKSEQRWIFFTGVTACMGAVTSASTLAATNFSLWLLAIVSICNWLIFTAFLAYYFYLCYTWLRVRYFLASQRIDSPWYKGWGLDYCKVVLHVVNYRSQFKDDLHKTRKEVNEELSQFYSRI